MTIEAALGLFVFVVAFCGFFELPRCWFRPRSDSDTRRTTPGGSDV